MQPKEGDNDFTLILKHGKEMRVSRNEIAASSDFFSTLLNSDMRENKEGTVRLEHITESCMRDVLEFIRSGSVEITAPEKAKELIEAAEYLLLDRLKTFSEKYLVQETLTSSNCMSIYYFAEQYRCQELTIKSREFILSNFAAVTESQEFLSLGNQQVVEWICRDDLAVRTEDIIFKAIVCWIQHSKSERKGKFEELFRHVRLSFISRDDLLCDVLANDLVSGCSNCLKLAKDALEGKCAFMSPRNWTDADRYLVVYMGKETFCYEPDRDRWYKLAETHLAYNYSDFNMCSFRGKLVVFPRLVGHFYEIRAEMFDPSSNRWTVTTFDREVTHSFFSPGLAVVRGQLFAVYRINDYQGKSLLSLSKYNFNSKSWKFNDGRGLIPVGPAGPTGPTGPTGPCIVAMDRYLYVIGGLDITRGHTISPSYRIDIRSENYGMMWHPIAKMKTPRWGACGTAAHGKIFIAGGSPARGEPWSYLDTCEVYNVEADEWQLIASLNSPRFAGSMVYLKGSLYVVGGCTGRFFKRRKLMTVERYDFREDKEWEDKTKLPINKNCAGCALNFPTMLVEPIPPKMPAFLKRLLCK